MKIIVEGPNGVGKTYFIEKLKEQEEFRDFEIEHTSQHSPNTYIMHKDLLDMPQNMIFDRFYLGETIYPYLHNREAQMTPLLCQNLYLLYKDSIVVIIDADYDFICKNLKSRGEEIDMDFIYKEKVDFYQRFKELNVLDQSRVFRVKNHIKGNYKDEETIDTVIEKVRMFYNDLH